MKTFKKIVIVLESLCLIGIIVNSILFFFSERRGVDYILSVVGIEIPQYKITSKEEKWSDYYDYDISFPTEYSASIKKQFENLDDHDGMQMHSCDYNETSCLLYCTDNRPGDNHYWVDINLQEGTASLRMSFEWEEQLDCTVYIYLLMWLGFFIGIIYLIAMLVCKLIKSKRNKF